MSIRTWRSRLSRLSFKIIVKINRSLKNFRNNFKIYHSVPVVQDSLDDHLVHVHIPDTAQMNRQVVLVVGL